MIFAPMSSQRLVRRNRHRCRPVLEDMETRNLLSSVVSNFDGVTVTSGHSLWHYQDGSGFSSLGGSNISTVVESHNAAGGEEMFARHVDGSIWSYTSATNVWVNTGGHLDTMIYTRDGIAGTLNGQVYHYQDNGGWYLLGSSNAASVVDSQNQYKEEEIFARSNSGQITAYTFSTGQWAVTNGYLETMVADTEGISGLIGGSLWHYQDHGGWNGTGGVNIVSIASTFNPQGQEELFIRNTQNHVWAYTPSTNSWFDTGASLETMTSTVGGIAGTINGHLWRYVDGAGWMNTGGTNVGFVLDGKNNYGGEVLFATLNDFSVWEYTVATNMWVATNGYVN